MSDSINRWTLTGAIVAKIPFSNTEDSESHVQVHDSEYVSSLSESIKEVLLPGCELSDIKPHHKYLTIYVDLRQHGSFSLMFADLCKVFRKFGIHKGVNQLEEVTFTEGTVLNVIESKTVVKRTHEISEHWEI